MIIVETWDKTHSYPEGTGFKVKDWTLEVTDADGKAIATHASYERAYYKETFSYSDSDGVTAAREAFMQTVKTD